MSDQDNRHKAIAAATTAEYMVPLLYKAPLHTSSLSSQAWMDELLQGHTARFKDQMGMERHVFCALLGILGRKGLLRDSKHVSAVEQLGIFLYICSSGLSNRKTQERFQRSADTISRCVATFLLSK